MKARIQELEAQLARERNSVNAESYYYDEIVSTKHRTYILCINAEPYYKYHTERRFNQAKYDQDVAAANNRIRNLEAEISSLKQQEIAEEQARQKRIAAEKARLEAIERAKIEAEITVVRKDLNQVQEKLNREKLVSSAVVAKRQEVENKCTQIKVANDATTTKINEQHQAIFQHLQSVDDSQRAFYLSELFGTPDSDVVIGIIKSLGFDSDQLAYKAIQKNDSKLFDFALSCGAHCGTYTMDNRTLLKQLVDNNQDSFIQKILASGQDISCTLLTAIEENDVITINKL
ncbi:MAG: hypothetical protein LN561_00335 [Rickettsia endosymbiont of Labidopullus appendiculatus]|nr:hypothetical protein [Rickettsia endosymbiont of Labidopullus appendiculatus]